MGFQLFHIQKLRQSHDHEEGGKRESKDDKCYCMICQSKYQWKKRNGSEAQNLHCNVEKTFEEAKKLT